MEDAYGRTSAAVASCWGRFGLAAAWRRLRRIGWPRRRYRTYVLGVGAGGLNYDQLSYAQNFDDGKVCECEPDFLARARYAAACQARPVTSSAKLLCVQSSRLMMRAHGIVLDEL